MHAMRLEKRALAGRSSVGIGAGLSRQSCSAAFSEMRGIGTLERSECRESRYLPRKQALYSKTCLALRARNFELPWLPW